MFVVRYKDRKKVLGNRQLAIVWGILNRCKWHPVAMPDPGIVGVLGKFLPPGPGVVAKKI